MQTRLLDSSVLPDVLGVKNVPIKKLIVTRISNIAATTLKPWECMRTGTNTLQTPMQTRIIKNIICTHGISHSYGWILQNSLYLCGDIPTIFLNALLKLLALL